MLGFTLERGSIMADARKYTFAIEIDPVEEGRVYTRMPLHCTIMHWFYTVSTPEELASAAKEAIEGHGPVELISKAVELYGPNRNIPVHPIIPSAELLSLHRCLYEPLSRLGVEYTHPEYVGGGYLPHVAKRDGFLFLVGSRHSVSRIYLAETIDEGVPPMKVVRQIVELVEL